MILDIDQTFGEIVGDGETFRAALLDIQRYSTDRQEALGWIDRMRFLAPISTASSKESGEHPLSWGGSDPILRRNATSAKVKKLANCSCVGKSVFEVGERRFRLTAPGEFSGCQHYVAVSYCWKRRSHGYIAAEAGNFFTVTDMDIPGHTTPEGLDLRWRVLKDA